MKPNTPIACLAIVPILMGCSEGNSVVEDPSATHALTASTTVAERDGIDAGGPEAPSSGTISNAGQEREVDANLQALRNLKVFQVVDLIVDIPEGGNCYDLPCPGHEREFLSREEARRRASLALSKFTREAVAAASSVGPEALSELAAAGTCYTSDAANLQTIKDLRIVSLGELILENPGQNPNCYHAPRALKLANIAHAVRRP